MRVTDGAWHMTAPIKLKPTFLTTKSGRQYISSGEWIDDLMIDYVAQHGQKKWLTPVKLVYCSFYIR